MTARQRQIVWYTYLCVVLLVAFALRVYRINAQSLWYDEGNSAVMAGRSLQQIVVNTAADIHPPLYYFLLHWWAELAGMSELSLRFLSVIFGLVSVGLVVVIGRRLFGASVAAAAGAVAAFSPFLIYYSQEARMYAQLCALSGLSMYLLIRLAPLGTGSADDAGPAAGPLEGGQEGGAQRHASGRLRETGLFVAFTLATAAVLYTQYFGWAVWLTQLVVVLALAIRPRLWRRAALLLTAQAAAVLLYIPWMPVLLHQMGNWATSATSTPLTQLLYNAFVVFSFGLSWDTTATGKSELLVAALLVLGLVVDLLWRRRRVADTLGYVPVAALLLVVPLLVVMGMELRRPTYQAKLVIPATLGYDLLLGAGAIALGGVVVGLLRLLPLRALPRWATLRKEGVAAVLLLVLAFFSARSLQAYYFNPKYARDNYRGVAQLITSQQQAGDAIVLNAPNQIEVLDYYYHGPTPRYPLPRQRPLDPTVTAQDLAKLAAQYKRIWVVEWAVQDSDPHHFIDGWLGQRYVERWTKSFGQVKLTLYAEPGR